MLHISVYATFANSIPIEQRDVEWSEVVEILRNIVVADNKDDVPLFNFVKFPDGKPRQKAFASAVTGFILDIDNTVLVNGVKQDLEAPLTPDEVSMLLEGYEYVLVSTHSHLRRPNNPRFRLFMPLAEPVAASRWMEYSEQALKQLGLRGVAGIDPCFHTVTQPYYFPSAQEGAPTFFQHNEGEWLKIDEPEPEEIRQVHGKDDRFSIAQVAKYWTDRCPEIDQYEPAPNYEVRMPCPIHNGHNPNFQINLLTGQWVCFSECAQKLGNGKLFGGDIYQYERVRYEKTFPQAKADVNTFLGIIPDDPLVPEDRLTPAEDIALTIGTLPAGTPEKDILIEVVKHKPSVRAALVEQLIQQTQVAPDEMAKLVAEAVSAVKVVAFRNAPATPVENFNFGIPTVLDFGNYGYTLDMTGITLTKRIKTKEGDSFMVPDKLLTTHPVWFSAVGEDLSTRRLMVQLSWFGVRGKLYSEWHDSAVSNHKDTLIGLNDPPIDQQTWTAMSRWLSDIRDKVPDDRYKEVASGLGWTIDSQGRPIYVWPDAADIEFVGKPFETLGTVDDWAKPLDDLLALGRDGYVALMCVGLACAAPALALLADPRNPLVALSYQSSQGKGTAIKYALSVFAKPGDCTITVQSTPKGAQDMLKKMGDMVAFFDEVQQMVKSQPLNAENIVYSMGNATRRVTSNTKQQAIGGEYSRGVRYLASEEPITSRFQKGAALRIIEMRKAPLPPNSAQLVQALQRAVANNYGALAPLLARYFTDNRDTIQVEIELEADSIKSVHPNLPGEDHQSVALVYEGCKILGALTGRRMPLDDIEEWLLDYLEEERARVEDKVDKHFKRTLDWLMSIWESPTSPTTGDGKGGGVVAIRGLTECSPVSPMEVLYETAPVRQFWKDIGMDETELKIWADRGYIESAAGEHKFTRRRSNLNGAKTIRITANGIEFAGYPRDLQMEVDP